MKITDISNNTIYIRFNYDPALVSAVKAIQGRRYNPERKEWYFPITPEGVDFLKEHKFPIPSELLQWEKDREIKPIEIIGLKKELYPFQKEGVAFINSRNGKALIADEPGLGKTIEFIAYLQLNPDIRPAVIICPASVKYNWLNEILTWTHINKNNIQVLEGRTPYPILNNIEIVILNYDILSDWTDELVSINPKIICTDECHLLKERKTKRTKAFMKVMKKINKLVALSGTPIVNRPIEFYTILKTLDPLYWGSFWKFAQEFCDLKHNGFGYVFTGASNTRRLHEKLRQTCMLRRTKAEVLNDLPDKTRTVIPLNVVDTQEYKQAWLEFTEWYSLSQKSIDILAKIEKLKQLAVKAKLKQSIEWIENFLESGNKLIVFCHHKFVVDTLCNKFGDITVKIDGSVSSEKRVGIIREFQENPDKKLFIGTLAAKEGITLTAASTVCFLELWWRAGDHSQAEDRCHRIGQKDAVNIYYLVAKDTIEEYIMELLDNKRMIIDMILDGKETEEESLLTELIKKLIKKESKNVKRN